MKHIILLISVMLLCACGSTKKAIEISEKPIVTNKEQAPKETVTLQPEVIKQGDETKVTTVKDTTKTISTSLIKSENSEAFNHNPFNYLLNKHVTKEGHVNYKGFKKDWAKLQLYLTALSDNMPQDSWRIEDKLAYWINAYNAMTIDLILRHYPVKSIKDIKNPWDQRYWKLGNKWYNLNEIEHDILRKMDEPRIHFGIVCASFSCPKLQNEAFIASNLESQLSAATKQFLSDPNRNKITQDSITISKIFQWFSKDFKQNGDLVDFLNQYSDITISLDAKTRYKDYNWDLNE